MPPPGIVLIGTYKDRELDDVEHCYPAEPYVLIDDKLRILSAVKNIWASRVTTVFPCQGYYATDRQLLVRFSPADVTITSIGNMLGHDPAAL